MSTQVPPDVILHTAGGTRIKLWEAVAIWSQWVRLYLDPILCSKSLDVNTPALGLSFLNNLIFSRTHELEGPREDSFPDRGQTAQAAVIVCV